MEINFNLDGLQVKAQKGDTILQAATRNGIYIPHLCYHSDLKPVGACRLCLVENSEGRLITSCETLVEEGMEISTNSKRVESSREMVARLLIANHEVECLTCAQNNQ